MDIPEPSAPPRRCGMWHGTEATFGKTSSTITARLDSSTGTVTVEAAATELSQAFNMSQSDENGIKTVEINIPVISGAKAYASGLPSVFLTSGDASRAVDFSGIEPEVVR